MSNGDDVLDNWEEIDEVGLKNTVQKIQAVTKQVTAPIAKESSEIILENNKELLVNPLDCSEEVTRTTLVASVAVGRSIKPMKLLQRSAVLDSVSSDNSSPSSAALKSPLDDMAASFQPVMMVLHKDTDDYQSVNYTQPTNSQTVKILRRPTQSSEPRNNGLKPIKPIKTLQQREQEYAEARLRILGAAKNPEDDVSAANAANENATTAAAAAAAPAAAETTPSAMASTATTATAPVAPMATSHAPALVTAVTALSTVTPPKVANNTSGIMKMNSSPLPRSYNNHNHYQPQQYHPQQQQQQQPPTMAYKQSQQQQQQPQSPLLPPNYFFAAPPMQHTQHSPAFSSRSLGGITALGHIPPAQLHHPAHPHAHSLSHHHHHHHHHQTWSPIVGGSVSSPTLRHQESVLRMPRGPDGSTGFQMRR